MNINITREDDGLLGERALNELVEAGVIVYLKNITEYHREFEIGIVVSLTFPESECCKITGRPRYEGDDHGVEILSFKFKDGLSLDDKIKLLLFNSPYRNNLFNSGILKKVEEEKYLIRGDGESLIRDGEYLFFPFIDQFDAQFMKA